MRELVSNYEGLGPCSFLDHHTNKYCQTSTIISLKFSVRGDVKEGSITQLPVKERALIVADAQSAGCWGES